MDEVVGCVGVFVLLDFTMDLISYSASNNDDSVSYKGHASLAMFGNFCCSVCSHTHTHN